MMTDIYAPTDNQVLRWWFDQQDDLTKALIRSQMTCLIEGVRKNSHGRQSLGEMGAMELAYRIGAWMNAAPR